MSGSSVIVAVLLAAEPARDSTGSRARTHDERVGTGLLREGPKALELIAYASVGVSASQPS